MRLSKETKSFVKGLQGAYARTKQRSTWLGREPEDQGGNDMVHIASILCPVCKEQKQVMGGSVYGEPEVCNECQAKEADKQRRLHFDGLNGLTVEERLRRIEEFMYDEFPNHTHPGLERY